MEGSGRPTTAVVTITFQRDRHLHRQRLGLVADPPDLHVVVGMGEQPDLPDLAGAPAVRARTLVGDGPGLPLAAARNAGAETALEAGASVVIFLDVDCIPGSRLVSSYAGAAVALSSPALLCGPVSYLPPPPPGGYADATRPHELLGAFHPGRPVPDDGELLADSRFELFWSLSFAVTARTWNKLGGFYEGYVGYGAEDTDFAISAEAAGAGLYWVGGAEAYHQYHPPSRSDPEHLTQLLRNARLFHTRHGWWPMQTWLTELAAAGLVAFDPSRGILEAVPTS